MHKKKFTDEELKKIDEADDLHISPFREDGKTYGTPTWIWAVVVSGDLYVRAGHGVNSKWYKAAMQQKAGRIHAAGMIIEVTYESVQGDINNTIDAAYRNKYGHGADRWAMTGDTVRAATVKINPK
jgi:hypothetical protein